MFHATLACGKFGGHVAGVSKLKSFSLEEAPEIFIKCVHGFLPVHGVVCGDHQHVEKARHRSSFSGLRGDTLHVGHVANSNSASALSEHVNGR